MVEKSHSPIAILDGRDGKTLRQWLKGNQHIKAITRDRASAYVKVISDELPDVMQVADRFHLNQNLLEAVKGALNHAVPANIKVVHKSQDEKSVKSYNDCKKIDSIVDNLSPLEQKRYQVICQIQMFLKEGCSHREIAKRMGISRRTIAKYRVGNPEELCESGINQSKLDAYKDEIIKCLHNGYSKSKTVKHLYSLGYHGAKSTAFDYLVKIERYKTQSFAPQPYVRTFTEEMKYQAGSKGKSADYITRTGIFRYLRMNDKQITQEHKNYILRTYPSVREILSCIRNFRNIFIRKSMPELYLFIERYSNSAIPELKSFAKSLNRDIEAVENAVASDLSNGFVEETNSKLKMVKRTVYGRCSKKLLSAKMILKY